MYLLYNSLSFILKIQIEIHQNVLLVVLTMIALLHYFTPSRNLAHSNEDKFINLSVNLGSSLKPDGLR